MTPGDGDGDDPGRAGGGDGGDSDGTGGGGSDATVEPYRTEFADGQRPSEAVVEAIAAVEDVVPTAVAPLYGSIDPDALDALFEDRDVGPEARETRTVFAGPGHRVEVSSEGTITVYDDADGE